MTEFTKYDEISALLKKECGFVIRPSRIEAASVKCTAELIAAFPEYFNKYFFRPFKTNKKAMEYLMEVDPSLGKAFTATLLFGVPFEELSSKKLANCLNRMLKEEEFLSRLGERIDYLLENE